ncbi:hypothetical protein DAMA08_037060 [Martiniozyma asiatica (nom. inval.)]|nr:hypothetical protein DAMA08_037060 [Martiniozyma asiatica]
MNCGVCQQRPPDFCSHCIFIRLLKYNTLLLPLIDDSNAAQRDVSNVLLNSMGHEGCNTLKTWMNNYKTAFKGEILLSQLLLHLSLEGKRKDLLTLRDRLDNLRRLNENMANLAQILNIKVHAKKDNWEYQYNNKLVKLESTQKSLNRLIIGQQKLISKGQGTEIRKLLKMSAFDEFDQILVILFTPVLKIEDICTYDLGLVRISLSNVLLFIRKLAIILNIKIPYKIESINGEVKIDNDFLLHYDELFQLTQLKNNKSLYMDEFINDFDIYEDADLDGEVPSEFEINSFDKHHQSNVSLSKKKSIKDVENIVSKLYAHHLQPDQFQKFCNIISKIISSIKLISKNCGLFDRTENFEDCIKYDTTLLLLVRKLLERHNNTTNYFPTCENKKSNKQTKFKWFQREKNKNINLTEPINSLKIANGNQFTVEYYRELLDGHRLSFSNINMAKCKAAQDQMLRIISQIIR